MRNIKFRAWDKRSNKWFGSSAVYLTPADGVGMPVFVYDRKNAEHVELMECTGMLDSEGHEIYEGDIVCTDEGNRFQVYYSPELGTWMIRADRELELGPRLKFFKLVVVGNVYQHPELVD